MKRTIFGLCLILAGCQPNPVPPPAQAMPVVEAPSPVVPKPVAAVTQKFRVTAQKEVHAITSPNATPDSVRSINAADVTARSALHKLEAQGSHPTPAAVSAAKAAVSHLEDVLNTQP